MAARRRPAVEPNATAPEVMQSVCKNITVSGRRTSVRMEPLQWDSLADICKREMKSVHDIATLVDHRRGDSSLTAALRVFILSYFREATVRLTGLEESQARFDGPGASSGVFERAMDVFSTETPEKAED
ncbi:ribbon-helix-helix domain-containing protein [Indioceanicola profundi]|uniref:ribbon-helix-helix domain-containing protein n=1 Tax=Indioceanicola profundi TaxID=2220096 RepID=UPI001CEC38C5|nr:ribbon-helix-helix domain-containing protein [Indioceanicola profundi]